MTLEEIISEEMKTCEEINKIIKTHVLYDDVTLEVLFADDTEIINEKINMYKENLNYQKQLVEYLVELKQYHNRDRLINLKNNNTDYETFMFLSCPVKFSECFKDTDYSIVNLYDIQQLAPNDIIGYCGVCKWENNQLYPLDGDIYCEEMLVYGYRKRFENGKTILDILVEDW